MNEELPWYYDIPIIGDLINEQTGAREEKEIRDIGQGQRSEIKKAQIEAAQERKRAEVLETRLADLGFGVAEDQVGFQKGGLAAFRQMQALTGALGPEAQQQAIAQLEASPQFQSMVTQGERAILQNAAATGGVRGGNVQSMLATFRPQLLSQIIEQQYSKLGGMAGLGADVGQGLAGLGAGAARGAAGTIMGGAELEAQLAQNAAAATAGSRVSALEYDRALKDRLLNALVGTGKAAASIYNSGV